MEENRIKPNRLHSLIFESVARTETFRALIEQTDTEMGYKKTADLGEFTSEFEDASRTFMRTGSYGKDSTEIEFSFDSKGRLTEETASFASLFGLAPGEKLYNRLGDSGRGALEDLTRGRRSQAAFTLFTHHRLRPVPVLARSDGHGTFRATAITLRWSNAIAPILKSGYRLTDTEIDVVELLFQGHQPKEIAHRRQRSLETVRTQVRRICDKTDTHGQADILHLIYGLIATTQLMHADQTAAAHGNFMVTLPSGRRIDVECSGPETGKPLLFLHGCLAGRRLPATALERFQDRRIMAPGRPGHGQTQKDDGLGVQDVAQDILYVLNHFGVETVDVLTYDLGAPYALWMAALQPERVSSLTCLAPVPPLVDWLDIWSLPVETRVFSVLSKANPSAAHYLALLGGQRILRQGPGDFGRIVFANSRFDREQIESDEHAQKLFWHGHAWHVERGPHGFLSDAKLSSTNWSAGLPKLEQPVSFLSGEHDRNSPKRGLTQLAALVGAHLTEIPDAGHSLLHTDADAWVPLLGH